MPPHCLRALADHGVQRGKLRQLTCVFFLPNQSFFNHSSLILSAAQTTVNHGLCPETHFSFDRPFPSPLDGTSLVSIMPFVGHMAFNANDYSDGTVIRIIVVAIRPILTMRGVYRW